MNIEVNSGLLSEIRGLEQRDFAYVREYTGEELSDLVIATRGYCMFTSSFLAPKIRHILPQSMAVFDETHSVLIGVSEFSGDVVSFTHRFTSIGSEQPSSDTDIIVDATYKQFLDYDDAYSLPNLFVGSRGEAVSMIQALGKRSWAHDLFSTHSLKQRSIVCDT